jgi:hypothetical protein
MSGACLISITDHAYPSPSTPYGPPQPEIFYKVLVVCYALETRPFGGRFCQVKSAGVNPVSLMLYVRIGLHCSTHRHIFFLKILLIRLC